MENSANKVSVRTGDWVLTFLIASIPIVGFVMLFVWAFSGNTNESKANWAKAALIWLAIITVIYIIIGVVFGATILSAFN